MLYWAAFHDSLPTLKRHNVLRRQSEPSSLTAFFVEASVPIGLDTWWFPAVSYRKAFDFLKDMTLINRRSCLPEKLSPSSLSSRDFGNRSLDFVRPSWAASDDANDTA
jgi:hypothetical protein